MKSRKVEAATPTGGQLRAARALIGITIAELATASGLAVNTIRRAEGALGQVKVTLPNMSLLVATLEDAGVLFIHQDELGPGVRLKSPPD